jgi:SynChlorMet cassette radical SAM/SPASM protein ScmF
MQVNAQHVEPVIELAEELGASSVKFNIIQPTGRGETISKDDKSLKIKDLIALGRKVESELAAKTDLELFFDYPPAFRSLSSIAPGDGCGVCGILSIMGVLPSGEYALCGMGSHVEQLHFGRIGQDSLAEVWQENHILQSLRNGLPEKLSGICSHCLMKHLCLGSCIAQNYYRTHSLWAPFWFCEQASAAGLFPDSRLDLTLNKKQKMI